MIKYLKTLGFNVVNDMFAQNSWYFRNALVRANYSNLQKGITETTIYLERFFRSMLLGEEYPFRNRELHIYGEEPQRLIPFKVQTKLFKVQILHFIFFQRVMIALWKRSQSFVWFN